MQSPIEPPREAHTTDAVLSVITAAEGVVFGVGCDATDLSFAERIPVTGLLGGSVSRAFFDTIHGAAEFTIAQDLPWGYTVLMPYCTLSDGTTTLRFDLGAYFTDIPNRPLAEKPVTYSVKCVDILDVLNTSVGDSFSLPAGAGVLASIEDILSGSGVIRYIIDQSAASTVLAEARAWQFEDSLTWLRIVNDLLAMVGYSGIWTDWAGRFRCEAYMSPRDRSPEFYYDTEIESSLIAPEREEEHRYEKAPNAWVFVRSGGIDTAPPVDGDGIYRYDNVRDGPTSQEARRRTILRRVPLDVPDHASLVAAAQRIIDADSTVPLRYLCSTFPNPLHWHGDILHLDDPARGGPVKVQGTRWVLPLDGTDMSHEWTVLL